MKLVNGPLWAGPDLFGGGAGRLLRVTALLAVLALFIGACGGGDDDSSSNSQPTPTTAAASAGGGASNSATGAVGATGATGAAGGTGATANSNTTGSGPTALADLTGLQSFRWDVALSGAGSFLANAGVPSVPGGSNSEFTATGAYIAPDQAQVTINAAGFEYKQTVKGGQQWTTVAGVTTGPTPATSDAQSLIYVTSFVDPESVVNGSSMNCGGSESVNGVSAVRCETTDEMNRQIVSGFAGSDVQTSSASFVMWIAQDGNYIVKWEFKAEGTANGEPFNWNFVANITDVNNVSSIEP